MKYIIAAGQMGPNTPDIMYNASRICDMMADAKKKNADLIVFPEMSLQIYYCSAYTRDYRAYHIEDSHPAIDKICRQAKELSMNVMFGYAEECDKFFYNTAMMVNRAGAVIGKYRKVHIPAPMIRETAGNFERFYFTPGNLGFPVFAVDGVRVGAQICYDRHMPEGYRVLAYRGADVVFNMTATVSYGVGWRRDAWELMLRARAFENGIFVVGVNKSGDENEISKGYYGNSMVITPLDAGRVLSRLGTTSEDAVLVQEIDLEDLSEARNRIGWTRDIRGFERKWYDSCP